MKSAVSNDPFLNDRGFDNRTGGKTYHSSRDDNEGDAASYNAPLSGTAKDDLERRTDQELLETVRRVENAVAKGTAQIRDYETFILCKKELLKRDRCELAF